MLILIVVVSSLVLCLLVCGITHLCLIRCHRQFCCLGLRIEDVESNDEDRRGSRAANYRTSATKWRVEKVKELRKLMKPFKFEEKKLEFSNQTDCCIC